MNKYAKDFHNQINEWAEQYACYAQKDPAFRDWADDIRLVADMLSKAETLRKIASCLNLLTVGRKWEAYSHAEKIASRIIRNIEKSDGYRNDRWAVRDFIMDLETEMDKIHEQGREAEDVLHDSVLAEEYFERLHCFKDFYSSKAVERADCLSDMLEELAKVQVPTVREWIAGMIREQDAERKVGK